MTIRWDPWHTVTVTAVTSIADDSEDHDDYELVFNVEHPEPHENGCPKNCMTQQAIDEQCDTDLPTEPGTCRIRAWGEYFPGGLACEPDWDDGIEIEAIDPDVTTLRTAAAQARAEGQEHDGPSRNAMFIFASMLMNEADKVESGDRGTLPPVLASARVWLDGAVNFDPAPVSETSNPIALLFFPESIPSAIPDIPPASTEPADWLIFSHEHSAWWKPARWGYTDLTSQAGKYTEAEAREICEKAAYRWKRGAGGPKALPPEVMVRADADDMFAAISEATREAVDAR